MCANINISSSVTISGNSKAIVLNNYNISSYFSYSISLVGFTYRYSDGSGGKVVPVCSLVNSTNTVYLELRNVTSSSLTTSVIHLTVFYTVKLTL